MFFVQKCWISVKRKPDFVMFSNERWKEKDMQETACLDWKGKGSVLVRILCGFHLKLFQQDT